MPSPTPQDDNCTTVLTVPQQHPQQTRLLYTAPSLVQSLNANINWDLEEDNLCEALQGREQQYFVTDGGATDGT
eukprot:13137371-Ditylum_brightwellii.AAC.1